MKEFNLKRILKALLLSTSEPLSIKDVQAVIKRFHDEADKLREEAGEEVDENGQSIMDELIAQVPTLLTATQIRDAMDELAKEFEEEDEVIRLLQGAKGYRITCAPGYADWIRLLREEPRPARLSNAAMETLAIIAYRQPVTRPEMEIIRGVSVDNAVNRLLEHDLIHVTGRAELPGRPLQYGTTETFLEFIGVRSKDELPASDVLNPNQITEWLRNREEQKNMGDKDMGLPESEPQQQQEELIEDRTDHSETTSSN